MIVGSIGACVLVVDDELGVVVPMVVVDVALVVLEEGIGAVVDVVLEVRVDDEVGKVVDVITPKSMSRRSSPSSRVT